MEYKRAKYKGEVETIWVNNLSLKEFLLPRTRGRCGYCGCKLKYNRFGVVGDIDHMVPQSRGGIDNHINLIMACKSCNRSKGNKTVDEFRKYTNTKKFYFERMKPIRYGLDPRGVGNVTGLCELSGEVINDEIDYY